MIRRSKPGSLVVTGGAMRSSPRGIITATAISAANEMMAEEIHCPAQPMFPAARPDTSNAETAMPMPTPAKWK